VHRSAPTVQFRTIAVSSAGKAAVSVQRAIDRLDSGDLDGARNVLVDLLGWP
jgi:hypothetical protein